MPPFPLVRCQAAENQTVSGVRVPWKIVPAVAETRRSQPAQRQRRSGARHPSGEAHHGHTNPSGQRSQSR